MTVWAMHFILHNILMLPVDVKDICVFTAPIFAALTTVSTYLLGVEVSGKYSAGLIAAVLMAVMPSYLGRYALSNIDQWQAHSTTKP